MENSGKSALGLDANVVAGLCYVANLVCYLGIVLSIIVLVTDKVNKLARFHAMQSLLLFGANLIILLPGYFIAGIMMAMNTTVTSILGGLVGLLVAVVGIGVDSARPPSSVTVAFLNSQLRNIAAKAAWIAGTSS